MLCRAFPNAFDALLTTEDTEFTQKQSILCVLLRVRRGETAFQLITKTTPYFWNIGKYLLGICSTMRAIAVPYSSPMPLSDQLPSTA